MPHALQPSEISKGGDQLTLVVLRDPGECSTFASRLLVREVVSFSNMGPCRTLAAQGLSSSSAILVQDVSHACTREDTSRTSLPPLGPTDTGLLHQELRGEGSPFGDHSNHINVTDASTNANPSDSEDDTTDDSIDGSGNANARANADGSGRWRVYSLKEVWAD